MFKEFKIPDNAKISYHEIDDWITMKMFRFQPYNANFSCFQFEFYGCPDGKYYSKCNVKNK